MDKVIIWGATGQAKVLVELLTGSSLKIEAFFENNPSISSPITNIPIYYGKEAFFAWIANITTPQNYYYLVAIGGGNGKVRNEISEMLNAAGLKPYTAIHQTAFVAANALIGVGGQILAGTNICTEVKIGKNCIINTAASIDHECVIFDNVHIGPGATLAGCVTVGENAFIGTNATILPRIIIGKNAIVGAGSVVTKNVPDNVTVVGNPARVLKNS